MYEPAPRVPAGYTLNDMLLEDESEPDSPRYYSPRRALPQLPRSPLADSPRPREAANALERRRVNLNEVAERPYRGPGGRPGPPAAPRTPSPPPAPRTPDAPPRPRGPHFPDSDSSGSDTRPRPRRGPGADRRRRSPADDPPYRPPQTPPQQPRPPRTPDAPGRPRPRPGGPDTDSSDSDHGDQHRGGGRNAAGGRRGRASTSKSSQNPQGGQSWGGSSTNDRSAATTNHSSLTNTKHKTKNFGKSERAAAWESLAVETVETDKKAASAPKQGGARGRLGKRTEVVEQQTPQQFFVRPATEQFENSSSLNHSLIVEEVATPSGASTAGVRVGHGGAATSSGTSGPVGRGSSATSSSGPYAGTFGRTPRDCISGKRSSGRWLPGSGSSKAQQLSFSGIDYRPKLGRGDNAAQS